MVFKDQRKWREAPSGSSLLHICQDLNAKQWEISLPVGQQDGEEQAHFAAAAHGRLHHLDVPEGSPVLSLAHEGLNYPHVLP